MASSALMRSRTGTGNRRNQRGVPSQGSTAATAPVAVARYAIPPCSVGDSPPREAGSRRLPLVTSTRTHDDRRGSSRSIEASMLTLSKRAEVFRRHTSTRPSQSTGAPTGTAPSSERSEVSRSTRMSHRVAPVAGSMHVSPPDAPRAPAPGVHESATALSASIAVARRPAVASPSTATSQSDAPLRRSIARRKWPSSTSTRSPWTAGTARGVDSPRIAPGTVKGTRQVSPQRPDATDRSKNPGPRPETAGAATRARTSASSAACRSRRGGASRSWSAVRSRHASACEKWPRASARSASSMAARRPASVSSRRRTSASSSPRASCASASGPTSLR